MTGEINADPNPLPFRQDYVVISWKTTDPAGSEVRVSTSPGHENLVSKTKKRSGQAEISWITGSTVYEFRLYGGSDPDTLIDSVRVWRDLNAASTALRELTDEALRGNVDMAEVSRFIAAVIPAYLQTDRFGELFPVLLRQFAIDALRGRVGETEISQFIGTAIPEHLDSSIAGKIIATPNPVPFGEDVLISWGTNDPVGGEVRLLMSSGEEKLISRQPSGQKKIPWITGVTAHEFRLYANTQPNSPLDSVKVRRDVGSTPAVMGDIANEVTRGNIDMMELSQFIARVMPRCLQSKEFHEIFQLWERKGFHVTPVHFYQPIPDTQNLPKTLWDKPSDLVGIDMNESMQLDLLRKHFPKFRNEYEQFPTGPAGKLHHFHLDNDLFGGLDALIAHCMVRHFKPRLIVEIGGGFSTLLLTEAAAKNNTSALICIEPFPQEFLKQGFPGLNRLIEKKVEDIDLEFFSELHSGDVLFIDSSHTVKIGGDVNYLFLEVLPRLEPGVIVHIHDIFLPFDYRRDWVLGKFRFWAEQYLLQAFLAFNSEFEVLMANNYVAHEYLDDIKAAFPSLEKLKAAFPNSVGWGGGSFWMRRKPRL
jgi:hypothetical protein